MEISWLILCKEYSHVVNLVVVVVVKAKEFGYDGKWNNAKNINPDINIRRTKKISIISMYYDKGLM